MKTAQDAGFAITITNVGAEPATGVVVLEKIGSGLLCPAENTVSIAGHGVPLGSFTLEVLIKSGIKLGTLNNGQSATLSYSCQAS